MAGRSFDPDTALKAYLNAHAAECRVLDCVPDISPWVSLSLPAVTLLALWLFSVTGLSARVRDGLKRLTRRRWLEDALFAPPLALWVGVAQLPVRWWLERVLNVGQTFHARFKDEKGEWVEVGRHASDWAWLRDRADDVVWPLLLITLLFPIAMWLVRRTPRWFWLAPAAVACFLLATDRLEGRYAGMAALPSGPLRTDIEAMARQVGHPLDRIGVAKRRLDGFPTAMDAAVTWLDGKPQVTFGAALFNDLPTAREGWFAPFRPIYASEVRSIAGHELAHIRLRHAELDMVVTLSLALLFAWFAARGAHALATFRRVSPRVESLSDVAAAPILLLAFGTAFVAFSLLHNALRLAAEHHADAVGLEIAGDPDGMALYAARHARGRFMDLPRLEQWLFYDHPTPEQRIRRATVWKADFGSKRWTATGLSGPIREPEWVRTQRERDRLRAARR